MKDVVYQDKGRSITLKAPAKINLFLKIINRRPDGYHEVISLMQKVELFDILELSREGETVRLSCPGSGLPEDQDNLVYRAAQAFIAATGEKTGIRIYLEKKIPVAAGLGGGSSDAAAVLRGLNILLSTGLLTSVVALLSR